MPSGTPSTVRTPFTDSDDRELVAFLAFHHPSKGGRMGNAVYKLLTEQPNRWPWGKRHTWMSWRERYKNHESDFDLKIRAFQQKNRLSRQAIPMGSEAMFVNRMEDLDDFGTDEEEDPRPRGKRAARVDSDSEYEDTQPSKPRSRPVSKAPVLPKQPNSKRKRASDTSDRTPKRTRVITGSGNGGTEEDAEEKGNDAMDQDSQSEGSLEVEKNLFCPSDEDSLAPRTRDYSHGSSTPKRSSQPPQSNGPAGSTSRSQRTLPHEPVHRPHSPKNPSRSPFSTANPDESDTDSPIIPKRLRKRAVPKIVESAFGRNKLSSPVRSSRIRADSTPDFNLLVEKRAARKAGNPKDPEVRTARGDMTWEELQELQRATPEPCPSSPSVSKSGSVEPRGSSSSSLHSGLTPRQRSRPVPSNAIDDTERKMIEAREELSKVGLGFRTSLPRPPLGSKSPNAGMDDDETRPFDESTHPFDETTRLFDETTRPFDEAGHLFDDSQTQSQEAHPFDEDSCVPSQETHPFDEATQQPPDSLADSQGQPPLPEGGASGTQIAVSPVPSALGGSERRVEAFLTTSLLDTGNGKHSRSLSHPQHTSPIDRFRPATLSSPSHPPRLPRDPATHGSATANSTLKRHKGVTPITTSRNSLRSPRSSTEDVPILSPQRARSGGVSPDDGRPKPMATQELRKLIENSPRRQRAPAIGELLPQTSAGKQVVHRVRLSDLSVKSEATTPGQHLRTKSTANDDPFSSPTGLKLSSPHPPTDATMFVAEQESPLAPVTTSQSGLDATIKPRRVRREATQDRSRRVQDSERPSSVVSLQATTTAASSTTLRKVKGVTEASVRGEDEDTIEESQTYDIERDLYDDTTGTPMMDLSVWPPKRIHPTNRASSHHRTSSFTIDPQNLEHERGGRRSSPHHGERRMYPEREVQDDREQRRHSRRLSGASFGSPIAASSPPNARRNVRGKGHDRLERSFSESTASSFSSRTSLRGSTPTAAGIMDGQLGLGFAPSEMDAYLGIQVACEKIAKTHGFQSDAVFRVYQEVKDLRKAEEIVIGMKRAAEKDAIERILKDREKERRKMGERSLESSTYWDRDDGSSRVSRRRQDVRDDEDDDDDERDTNNGTIYEEEEDDPDNSLRVEHLSHRTKRASAPSTSTLRHRGGYERPRVSTSRMQERNQVRDREGSMEYHPPTPTRASLWERLSKSGRHPDTALMGESLRASLSMPRYEVTDHE